jgi:hypothetical protein
MKNLGFWYPSQLAHGKCNPSLEVDNGAHFDPRLLPGRVIPELTKGERKEVHDGFTQLSAESSSKA